MKRPAATTRLRTPLIVAGIVVLTHVVWAPAQAISVSRQPAALRQPAAPPPTTDDSLDAVLRRLRAKPAKERTREDRALLAGLAFCRAVRNADGASAHKLLDVVGYQPLPLAGELPENPSKPITPSALAKLIDARPAARPARIAAEFFKLGNRETVRRSFPGVARWMLPRDFALVIEPPVGAVGDAKNWATRRCCIVIRLRARKASIIAGNLFEALDQPAAPERQRPERG